MSLTLLGRAFWLIGFLGQALLLGILVFRGRARNFPFFTAFIAFGAAQTIINYCVYTCSTVTAYFWTYWALAIIDAGLQITMVYEMTRDVLRPNGIWSREARQVFLVLGISVAILAAALSFAVHPRLTTDLYAWSIRLDLFTSLLIAELVIAIFIAARRVGLQLGNWVMNIAEGLGLWVCTSLCVETAHSYWGWTQQYVALDYVRMTAYIGALVYWCFSLWHTEPNRRPLPAEFLQSVDAIRHSLEYDLISTKTLRKK